MKKFFDRRSVSGASAAPKRSYPRWVAILCTGLGLSATRAPAAGATLGTPVVVNSYRAEPAFGKLGFEEPVQVVFAPGDGARAFVVERGGVISAVQRDVSPPTRSVFLDLRALDRALVRAHGLLTVAFHPRFAENGVLFAWYSIMDRGRHANRLARVQLSLDGKSRATLVPLITQATGLNVHDGATLLFGPDRYLYLSLGDGDERASEPAGSRQHIDRSFFGGVLRLDVDQRPDSLTPNPHPAVHPGTYRIPADNPFVGATGFNGAPVSAPRVRTEFWCVGLRNPWRMAFDAETGALWCGDVGLKTREEIDVLVRGGNYGWNFREGTLRGTGGSAPASVVFVEPVWEYPPAVGMSVTGGIVYRGLAHPELTGKYLFADYVMGRVWALAPDGTKPVGVERVQQIAIAPAILAFAQDPRTDDVLLTNFSDGQILRLVRKGPAAVK